MAGELPFGWAPSGELTAYTPTLRERAADWLRPMLFSDDRAGQDKANRLVNWGETMIPPFGFATSAYDAGRAGGEGDYATAAILGAMTFAPSGKLGKDVLKDGMAVSSDELVDLFHGTTPEGYDAITSSKQMFESSRFSPRKDVAESYAGNVGGDANTVVRVKAPISALMIDLDLPGGKLLPPDEAAAYLDKPDWTISDFIEHGYSVGVADPSVLKF